MSFLIKLEDFFVQIIRLVLLAFAVVVLVALGLLLVNKVTPKVSTETAQSSVVWQDVKPDMQFVVEETGRDMGMDAPQMQLQERLTDPQLRPAFQQLDKLVRDFVAQKPEHHARIENDHQARGLAPLHPLLSGAAMPTAQEIDAYVQQLKQQEQAQQSLAQAQEDERERLLEADEAEGHAQAAIAAQAAAEDCCWSDPLDIAQMLHERAAQAHSEYGETAYVAFVKGAPEAVRQVLGDAKLAPRLHDLPVARLLDMVLTNYSISFSRAVNAQDSSSDSLWDLVFNSIELTMWSVILSFLVLVVFVVMMIRMEKHLRSLSMQGVPPR